MTALEAPPLHPLSWPREAALHETVLSYASSGIFARRDEPWTDDNPFRRPLLNEPFTPFDTTTPLPLSRTASNASLVAQRILMSIYERDFVFLPKEHLEGGKWDDFQTYYGDSLRVLGELIRSHLEPWVFRAVADEVSVSGTWTMESFTAYFEDFRKSFTAAGTATLMEAIRTARNPVAAAQTYLIQLAGDFLVESSAMARNAIGNYGPLQSHLFKIVIDECGYGVHSTRHSTLYQNVLVSRGFSPIPHAYWELYLPSSFYLNNYYSYICRDHRHLFKYFGAILQVETAFRVTCGHMADMMTAVFGDSAETQYFREHVHIDTHHSRMVLEEIIVPAVEAYGNSILPDIVRGFEESRIVGNLFGDGLMSQILWGDSFFAGDCNAQRVTSAKEAGLSGRWRGTQVSDGPMTFAVRAGELDLVAGYGIVATYGAGQSVSIPAGVLYAACPSADCEYEVRADA